LRESNFNGDYLVSIPAKAAGTPAAPKTPPGINQYDSRWVPLDETSITKPFVKVQIDGKDVISNTEPSPDPKGLPYKKVEVFVTRVFSEKPGTLEVNFLDASSNMVDRATIVINCTGCQTNTDSKETKK
jgi:hypothetical protein